MGDYMIRRTFNLFASITAFALGTIYLFSDGASVTANVVGASGSNAGFSSLIGVVMIIGAIGLFMVTLHHIDNREVDLEKLVRRTPASTTATVPETLSEPAKSVNPTPVMKETKTNKHHKNKK